MRRRRREGRRETVYSEIRREVDRRVMRNVAGGKRSFEENWRSVSRCHPSFPEEQIGVSGREIVFSFDWIRHEVHDYAKATKMGSTQSLVPSILEASTHILRPPS
jgi:hypothetical protein